MYLVANNSPARSSIAELVGAGDVAACWLIDEERSGATLGKIGLIEIGSGGSARLTPDAGREHMLFVLHGRCHVRCNSVDADVHKESVIFLPGGEAIEVQPHHDTSRLLLIQGGRAAAGVERRSRPWTKWRMFLFIGPSSDSYTLPPDGWSAQARRSRVRLSSARAHSFPALRICCTGTIMAMSFSMFLTAAARIWSTAAKWPCKPATWCSRRAVNGTASATLTTARCARSSAISESLRSTRPVMRCTQNQGWNNRFRCSLLFATSGSCSA